MKLSKANEDTLKGLAAFLKDLQMAAAPVSPETEKRAKGLEKDLRQLRKNLKEMPEPELETAEFSKEGVAETYAKLDNTSKDAWRCAVFSEMKERLALPNGDEARLGPERTLQELNLIDCKAVNQCAEIELPGVVNGTVDLKGQVIAMGAIPESEFEEVPTMYVNKMQVLKQQSLIGVTYAEPDENRTLALYRKKS